jgi:hypothetical protein
MPKKDRAGIGDAWAESVADEKLARGMTRVRRTMRENGLASLGRANIITKIARFYALARMGYSDADKKV